MGKHLIENSAISGLSLMFVNTILLLGNGTAYFALFTGILLPGFVYGAVLTNLANRSILRSPQRPQ